MVFQRPHKYHGAKLVVVVLVLVIFATGEGRTAQWALRLRLQSRITYAASGPIDAEVEGEDEDRDAVRRTVPHPIAQRKLLSQSCNFNVGECIPYEFIKENAVHDPEQFLDFSSLFGAGPFGVPFVSLTGSIHCITV